MLHCDLRVRWKVASDLRFRAAISEPQTPSFCGTSGDLASSMRKSLAIAIVRALRLRGYGLSGPLRFISGEFFFQGGVVEKRGGRKTSPRTPLPKRVLDPPFLWYVFHPLMCCCCVFFSGKTKEPKPRLFGPDIFGWGLPREGVGAKKFGMPCKTQENQTGLAGYPGISAGISRGCPKSLRKKRVSVQLSHHFGGVLTSLRKYRAIWGIAAIVLQYCAIFRSQKGLTKPKSARIAPKNFLNNSRGLPVITH